MDKAKDRRSSRSSHGSGLETVAQLEVPAVTVKSQDEKYKRCCFRFDWERGVGMFSLKEPNRRALDVRQTFAPEPRFLVILIRVAFVGLSVATVTLDVMEYPDENLWIYCGFLSQWALIIAMAYQLGSLVCSLWKNTVEQPPRGLYRPHFLVKMTWLFFAVGLNLQLFAAILYWAFLFQGSITCQSVMKHGGIFLALLLDGFVIGRIPLRIQHLIAVWIICCLYLIWMGINEALGLGNGTWPNEKPEDEINDDTLYEMVQWKERPYYSFFICVVAMFTVIPVLFLMLWMMSFASAGFKFDGTGRRLYYYPVESKGKGKGRGKSEKGSVTPNLDAYLVDDHTVVTGHDSHYDETTVVTTAAELASACMWAEDSTPDYVPLDDDRDEAFYNSTL